jgi:hypothetical protein
MTASTSPQFSTPRGSGDPTTPTHLRLTPELRQYLHQQCDYHASYKERFFASTARDREVLAQVLKKERDALLEDSMALSRRQWPELDGIWQVFRDYVCQCDWVFLDAIVLAVCLGTNPEELGRKLAPRLLVYHAMRMFDDVVDDHLDYKGFYPTAYGVLRRSRDEATARGLTVVAAATLLVFAVSRLSATAVHLVQQVAAATLKEISGIAPGEIAEYHTVVKGKMVAYSSIIYDPIITDAEDPTKIREFVVSSFRLAQIINDLHDLDDDAKRFQPNFWSLNADRATAASYLLRNIDALNVQCRHLPVALQPYGHTRVADLAQYMIIVTEAATT